MKVKQIIEKLQKYDGNCECEIYVASGCESQKILKVKKSIVDKNKVIIFPKFVMTSHLMEIKRNKRYRLCFKIKY